MYIRLLAFLVQRILLVPCMDFGKYLGVGSLNSLSPLKFPSCAYYSLFTYHVWDAFLCFLIYVGDLLITGNSLTAVNNFKESLSSSFHMKDLGVLKYFLGIEVA